MSSPTAASIWGTGRTANPMVMGFTLVMAKLGMQVHLKMESNTEEVHTTLMVANTSATLRRANLQETVFNHAKSVNAISEISKMEKSMAKELITSMTVADWKENGRKGFSQKKVNLYVRTVTVIKGSLRMARSMGRAQ